MSVKSLLEVLYGRVSFSFTPDRIMLPDRWRDNIVFMSQYGGKKVKGIHIYLDKFDCCYYFVDVE